MADIIKFKAFCIERYRYEHRLSGKEVVELFLQYGVFEYISSFYDVLHSFGDKYIVQDIDLFIAARKTA
ncbi:MAG: DUF3791 domain-containing protein [Oscillospiraceae bacterium]|nr:DUF3791 domain-containing protein [Oscillospiraceae bacterium]